MNKRDELEAAAMLERDGAEIARLERALKLQRNAALTLADASAAVSGARLEQARKLFAESRPESVESERAMNAILTADVERLERELAEARDERARGTEALRTAFGEELWQLGHPAYVVVHLRGELGKVSRLWKSVCVERDEARKALAEAREALARWLIAHGFATGHGDTLDDLLGELSWQVKERSAEAEALRKEAARMRGALEMLYPGLVLDLRYADADDDRDALQSRIDTVEEALSLSTIDAAIAKG